MMHTDETQNSSYAQKYSDLKHAVHARPLQASPYKSQSTRTLCKFPSQMPRNNQ